MKPQPVDAWARTIKAYRKRMRRQTRERGAAGCRVALLRSVEETLAWTTLARGVGSVAVCISWLDPRIITSMPLDHMSRMDAQLLQQRLGKWITWLDAELDERGGLPAPLLDKADAVAILRSRACKIATAHDAPGVH